jgi:hypothetical protein
LIVALARGGVTVTIHHGDRKWRAKTKMSKTTPCTVEGMSAINGLDGSEETVDPSGKTGA